MLHSLQAQILNPKAKAPMATPNEIQQFIQHWAAVELEVLARLLGLNLARGGVGDFRF